MSLKWDVVANIGKFLQLGYVNMTSMKCHFSDFLRVDGLSNQARLGKRPYVTAYEVFLCTEMTYFYFTEFYYSFYIIEMLIAYFCKSRNERCGLIACL